MFFVLIACQVLLVSVTSANPFHKYPYVFLLDIGNEELKKTNTEQIRVTVPGGSLALRYPATQDGDTIAHVRVSGIDFGTDLKANVVDGGPGSKYVVIVFMGNQGTPYDAVVTIQTVSDDDMSNIQNTNDLDGNDNIDDNNDSAEDLNDYPSKTNGGPGYTSASDSQSAGNTNSEIRQMSYSAYGYTNSESEGDENNNEEIRQPSYNTYSSGTNDDYENPDSEDSSYSKDFQNQFSEANQEESGNNEGVDNDVASQEEGGDEKQQLDNEENSNENGRGRLSGQVERQHSDFSDDYGNEDNDNVYINDNANKYTKYQSLMPKLYGGLRIYPQNAVPFVFPKAGNPVYNSEDPNEVDQTFNDEEYHNNNYNNNKDKNNNFFDSDDSSAVES